MILGLELRTADFNMVDYCECGGNKYELGCES
jgi:hypothetical protein